MAQDDLLKFYSDNFDFHPNKATPEQAATFDRAIAAIENAQANPYVIQGGKWVENPDLVALREKGIPRKYAQMLSLWRSYKAQQMPESLDRDRLARGGVPADQIERVSNERKKAFIDSAAGAYQMWARDDEQSATKKGKPQSQPDGSKSSAQSAPETKQPEAPSGELQVNQPGQFAASINQGGQFVPAQMTQDPNVDPKTGLHYDQFYTAQNGALPPTPDMQLADPDIDPKTGLSYSTPYPDKSGNLPPDPYAAPTASPAMAGN
jgi:hypothetical protein